MTSHYSGGGGDLRWVARCGGYSDACTRGGGGSRRQWVHTRARKDGGERGEIVVVASKVEKERERGKRIASW